MPEPSDRLDLIQRAAKRLMGGGEGVVAPLEPAGDRDRTSQFLESKEFLRREQTSDSVHQAKAASSASLDARRPGGLAQTAGLASPVRLNFSELRRSGMITPDNLNSSISFEFRVIKRKILSNARAPNSNSLFRNLVMVTSALPGEGKTFTTTNLALALAAERDLHVLLIDADVIKPSLGNFFEPSNGKGLTDLLNGNCNDVAEIMHPCANLPNLSMVFAGERDERAPELISSRRSAEIFLELSNRYKDRVVIFDTSPVLASSEPANLAPHMHQIVMVVSAWSSTRSQLQTALETVSACPNISLIFNKAPKWHKVDGESYYYYGNNSATPS